MTETFDNLENGKIKVESGAPDKETVAELTEEYRQLDYDNLPRALKVQIFTLLALLIPMWWIIKICTIMVKQLLLC